MVVGYRSYGLTGWGLERVPTRADFLFAALSRHGGRATSEELYAEGRRLYGFLGYSMLEALKAHPERFRRVQKGIWEIVSGAVSGREIGAVGLGRAPAATATNTLESRIEKEIEVYKRKTGDLTGSHYLNNFYGHLPGGFYRRPGITGLKPYTNPGGGKRRKEMSRAQFHELIDGLISELGVDLTEIAKLHEGRDDDDAFHNILPLYVRLRKEGFKHYPDLTA
ncbi:MAG: hypothetical protein NUW21_10675 [Elusimicrobia bacterium]|nr:hypothetical protein [Elusimicrobiota bacterium]